MRKNNQIKPILKTQAAAQKVTVSKTTRNYRALVFQGYLVIAVLVFIGLAILAHIFPYFPIDLFMAKYWQSVHIPGLPAFMAFISYFGYGPQMPLIVTGLLLFILISGLRWEAVVGTVNIVGASLITSILKTIVGRGRPSQDLVNVITNLQDKSFPSGHVLTYTAFFGYLFFLSYILVKTSIFRRILLIIFWRISVTGWAFTSLFRRALAI